MEERKGLSVADAPPDQHADWMDVDWTGHVRDAWIGGRRLRYADYGQGPAIVLLHGLGMSWQWWLGNIPALGERLRVIAVDLPGFGYSDPLPAPGEMSTHAAVILELADQLKLDQITVVGHSMGGLITLEIVRQAPERVAGIGLVNAGGVPLSDRRLALVVSVVRLAYEFLRRPAIMQALARRPRLRHALLRMGLHRPDAVTSEFAAQVMPQLAGPGFVEAIAAAARAVKQGTPPVACPVCIIWGAHDRLLPLSAAEALTRELPQAGLHMIATAGHTPMIEEPAEVNRILLSFAAQNR